MYNTHANSFLTSGTHNSAMLIGLAMMSTGVMSDASTVDDLGSGADFGIYSEGSISSSYSSPNLSVVMAEKKDTSLESTLMAVYASISSSQVSAEAEFEEILEDNFWDLCEA